jgi:transposase
VLTNAIRVQLRLPGLIVLEEKESEGCIEVATMTAAEEAVCPRCRRATRRVHQWLRQRKRDAKLWGKPVWIVLFKRRFRCYPCRYVFTEDDPAWAQAAYHASA